MKFRHATPTSCLLSCLVASLIWTAPALTAKPVDALYVARVEPLAVVQQNAPFAGKVLRQLVAPGTAVRKGQPVLALSRTTLGADYGEYLLRANIAGLVDRFHLDPGTEFSGGETLVTLVDTSKYRLRFNVSDKDQQHFAPGAPLKLKADTLPQPIEAVTKTRSLTPIDRSGLFRVEVELAHHDDLHPGQLVTVIKESTPKTEARQGN